MIRKLCCLAAIAIAHYAVPAAQAGQVTLDAAKDATIFQNGVNNGSGYGNGLFAGTNGMSSPRRALIAFTLPPQIPSNATITQVELKLVLGLVAGGGSGSQTIEVHSLSAVWGEATTQQATPPTNDVGNGQGATAVTGDVTWNSQFHNANPAWATPGGVFGGISASLSVGADVGMTYTFGSTPGLVADVQGWLNNPSSNFGWLLKAPVAAESTPTNFRAFYSRNVANPALHPKLVVTFTPEPSCALLSMGAWAALAAFRRRRGRN